MNNNYFPKREKEIQIPEFLASRNEQPDEYYYDEPGDVRDNIDISAIQEDLNDAVAAGEAERMNGHHLKQLDKQVDAYAEDEARVAIKRLVSNYPEIALDEMAKMIKDMQDLASSILKNSRDFAQKRGDM